MGSLRSIYILVSVVAVAGCVPLEEPGGLIEPHSGGVISQAGLDSGPIEVSPERRAQLEAKPPVEQTEPPTEELEALAGDADATQPSETPGGAAEPSEQSELPTETEVSAEAQDLTTADSSDEDVPPADADSLAESEQPADEEPPADADATGEEQVRVEEDAPSEVQVEPVADPPEEAPQMEEDSHSDGDTAAEEELPPEAESESKAAAQDVETLVPQGPASDAEALAALDRLPKRESLATSTVPVLEVPIPAPERCLPGNDPETTPLSQLRMSGWDSESGKLQATLVPPSGEVFRVEVGDRVGPHGGLVVAIDTNKVTVYELRLDEEGRATKVQAVIKLKE